MLEFESDQWLFAAKSVCGLGHERIGEPCQDDARAAVSRSGDWMAVVVCDGAGSAARAKEASSLAAERFSEALVELSEKLETTLPGDWVNDFIVGKILAIRETFRALSNSSEIREFHTTLVAALLGPSGGLGIHIGDGALYGGKADVDPAGADPCSLKSEPENGEYLNETFFITSQDWIKHIRVFPLGNVDWLVLCSDGGDALLSDSKQQLKPGFIGPLLTMCGPSASAASLAQGIDALLSDPNANSVTHDDKTIAVLVKNHKRKETGDLGQKWQGLWHKKSAESDDLAVIKRGQRETSETSNVTTRKAKAGKLKPKSKIEKKRFSTLFIISIVMFIVVLGVLLGVLFYTKKEATNSPRSVEQRVEGASAGVKSPKRSSDKSDSTSVAPQDAPPPAQNSQKKGPSEKESESERNIPKASETKV